MYKIIIVLAIGLVVGYTGNEFWPLGNHAQCIDDAESRIASKNLDLGNNFTATFNARKSCDKKYEVKLDDDEEADLIKIIGLSSTLRFGENGLHYLTVNNSNPNFIVTNLEVEMQIHDEFGTDNTYSKTGYIRVMPNSEIEDLELNTNIYGTSDLSDSNFSFSISEVWGVEVIR